MSIYGARNFNEFRSETAGNNLDQLIKARQRSRRSVATAIGYDPSYLNRICKGQKPIASLELMTKILDELEIHGYERVKIMWENGLIDRQALPQSISEEVFTMLSALASGSRA